MNATAIEIHNLQKSYDGRPVLRGLSFAVGAGELFGIAGRNGAGKTTTIEILQGLRSYDGGSVDVLGFDPARDRARLRPLVGAQLQTSALPDRLRVGEALRLFARLAGDRVDWRRLAEAWSLEPLLGRSFGALSGGERQRLFLALALVNRPRLVFLDELTQGLDPVARRETWQLVEEARAQGTTVVLVTHDMDEAERLCDRVAVIHEGRVLTSGRPAELVNALGTVRCGSPPRVRSRSRGSSASPASSSSVTTARWRTSPPSRAPSCGSRPSSPDASLPRPTSPSSGRPRGRRRLAPGRRPSMSRTAVLAATEARLLVRDWTVLAFAFVFPPFVMLVLAGVFGSQPDDGYGGKRPDDYYVAASVGIPVIALALVGLPVALASYRERGVLRRLEALGVSRARVVIAQALVTCALVVVGGALVLAVAAPTYGIPHLAHPLQTLFGLVAGTLTLVLIGITVGLAAPTARAAQAIGLLAFFPLYLLGGGGPPRGAMTGPMRAISEALPSTVPAITDPWLGVHAFSPQLAAFAAWAAAALAATWWLARRRTT